jgi:hypothetical protein
LSSVGCALLFFWHEVSSRDLFSFGSKTTLKFISPLYEDSKCFDMLPGHHEFFIWSLLCFFLTHVRIQLGFVCVVLKRFEEKRSNYLLLLCDDDQHEAVGCQKSQILFMVADDFLYLKCIAGCIAVLLRIMH